MYSPAHRIIVTSLFIIVLFSPLAMVWPVAAERAVGPTWDRTYLDVVPGTSFVEQTRDGGFIISAFSRGGWVMKANAAGLPEWQKEYSAGGGTSSVEQTSEGGFMVIAGDQLLKLDHLGNVVWSKTYGRANTFFSGRQTSDGGYIMAGNTQSFGDPYDTSNGWVVRLNGQGGMLWQEVFAAQDVYSIDETGDGSFLVAGAVGLPDGQAGFWVAELGAKGSVAWQKAYDFPQISSDSPNLVLYGLVRQATDGGIIAAARVSAGFVGVTLILKLDPLGNIVWQKSYNGGGLAEPYSVSEMSDGGFIVAGRFLPAYSNAFPFPLVGLSGPFLLRLDANGDMLWQKIYGGANDFLLRVQATRDGGIIAVGSKVGGFPSCCELAWALKLDSDGNLRGCPVGVLSNATLADTSTIVASTTIVSVNTNATPTPTDVTVTTPTFPSQDLCSAGTKTR